MPSRKLRYNTLPNLKIRGQTVFDRVDFNVVEGGKIIDEFRIEAALPTVRALLAEQCAVILASHNGRPDGKADKKLSLEPVARALADLLERPVKFMPDCVGPDVEAEAKRLEPGDVLLLENLRFHKEEEKNDPKFAAELAGLAQVYVDDAFAVAHRAHASVVGVPKLLPHAAGLLMDSEYSTLHSLLERPKRPFVAIIGGAKVSDKLEVLQNLIPQVDVLAIAGAMANTFLYAQGYGMGGSIMETNLKKEALNLLKLAKARGVKVILPSDLVVATAPTAKARTQVVAIGTVPRTQMALDIGPKSSGEIITALRDAKTIFWNGTLGMAELNPFAHASYKVAHAITKARAQTIIGGGDTTSFIDNHGLHEQYDFVSTGGGASLDVLAGKDLPALDALA